MSRHRCQPTKIFKFPKKVLDIFCVPCYYIEALKRAAQNAPVAQLDRVTDYESVGQGFESLPAYQIGYLRVSDLFYLWTRISKMQQSGGLLLLPGSTGRTPLFSPIPGRKRSRVPSGVPEQILSGVCSFLFSGAQNYNCRGRRPRRPGSRNLRSLEASGRFVTFTSGSSRRPTPTMIKPHC